MNNNNDLAIASLAYYLYRMAGCPHGNTSDGLTLWLDIQKQIFNDLAKRDSELAEGDIENV